MYYQYKTSELNKLTIKDPSELSNHFIIAEVQPPFSELM